MERSRGGAASGALASPSVFISYRRRDSEDPTARLYERLVRRLGADRIFRDTTDILEGERFPNRIRDALAGCSVVLAIIGPHWLVVDLHDPQDWVRRELQSALKSKALVIPVLVGRTDYPEPAKMPPALRPLVKQLNAAIIHGGSAFERDADALAERVASHLGIAAAAPQGAPPTASVPKGYGEIPDPPKNYLVRADLASLIDQLTATPPGGGATRLAIHGMGGVGKTVTAAAVTREHRVRERYPDGVYWLTVGQEEDPAAIRALLAQGMGLPGDSREQIRATLRGQRVLVVLDDVWTSEAFSALDIAPSSGALVVTTRNADVLSMIEVDLIGLGVLEPEDAMKFLARWAQVPDATSLPVAARQVAEYCGYHPLALAAIGSMVRMGPTSFADALRLLQKADVGDLRLNLPGYRYDSVLAALTVSIDALPDADRERYLDLAVFFRSALIPDRTLRVFWGVDDVSRTRLLMSGLAHRSLAKLEDVAGELRIRVHDLLHDVVTSRRRDVMSALHDRVVRAWGVACGERWAHAELDSYYVNHLARHAAAAGRRDALLSLSSPEWEDARVRAGLPSWSAADLDLIIEAASEEPVAWRELVEAVVARSGHTTLAVSHSPLMLGCIACTGRAELALELASHFSDHEMRCDAHRIVAAAAPDERSRALGFERAVDAARRVSPARRRWQALALIARDMQLTGRAGDAARVTDLVMAAMQDEVMPQCPLPPEAPAPPSNPFAANPYAPPPYTPGSPGPTNPFAPPGPTGIQSGDGTFVPLGGSMPAAYGGPPPSLPLRAPPGGPAYGAPPGGFGSPPTGYGPPGGGGYGAPPQADYGPPSGGYGPPPVGGGWGPPPGDGSGAPPPGGYGGPPPGGGFGGPPPGGGFGPPGGFGGPPPGGGWGAPPGYGPPLPSIRHELPRLGSPLSAAALPPAIAPRDFLHLHNSLLSFGETCAQLGRKDHLATVVAHVMGQLTWSLSTAFAGIDADALTWLLPAARLLRTLELLRAARGAQLPDSVSIEPAEATIQEAVQLLLKIEPAEAATDSVAARRAVLAGRGRCCADLAVNTPAFESVFAAWFTDNPSADTLVETRVTMRAAAGVESASAWAPGPNPVDIQRTLEELLVGVQSAALDSLRTAMKDPLMAAIVLPGVQAGMSLALARRGQVSRAEQFVAEHVPRIPFLTAGRILTLSHIARSYAATDTRSAIALVTQLDEQTRAWPANRQKGAGDQVRLAALVALAESHARFHDYERTLSCVERLVADPDGAAALQAIDLVGDLGEPPWQQRSADSQRVYRFKLDNALNPYTPSYADTMQVGRAARLLRTRLRLAWDRPSLQFGDSTTDHLAAALRSLDQPDSLVPASIVVELLVSAQVAKAVGRPGLMTSALGGLEDVRQQWREGWRLPPPRTLLAELAALGDADETRRWAEFLDHTPGVGFAGWAPPHAGVRRPLVAELYFAAGDSAEAERVATASFRAVASATSAATVESAPAIAALLLELATARHAQRFVTFDWHQLSGPGQGVAFGVPVFHATLALVLKSSDQLDAARASALRAFQLCRTAAVTDVLLILANLSELLALHCSTDIRELAITLTDRWLRPEDALDRVQELLRTHGTLKSV